MLDAFHVVKLATQAVDEVRRRVQQDIHGHRGRKNDPLYRIRNILRAGAEHLTDRQRARLDAAFAADERHDEVEVAWQCAQQVRSAYHQASHAAGRADRREDPRHASPPARSPRSPASAAPWSSGARRSSAYFATGGANNGGTEAINGLIELHRRIARGFRNRDNYRLRMLLIGGGLNHTPHSSVKSLLCPIEMPATAASPYTEEEGLKANYVTLDPHWSMRS